MAQFVEQIDTDEWEIETPTGFQPFTGVGKTVSYQEWRVVTDRSELVCADDHIVYVKKNDTILHETHVKNLVPGDKIWCRKDNFETVISVDCFSTFSEMYDVMNVANGNCFYTGNIVSHNSTCIIAWLLHYCLFNSNVKVAILANKASTAKELLEKFKIAYENLPNWLQQGIKEWNKLSIELENGAKIITAATSSAAIRGMSLNCVAGDTIVDVKINGVQHTTPIKNIENLPGFDAPGQIFIKFDDLKIKTKSGNFEKTDGILITSNKTVVKLEFDDGSFLTCTPNHQIETLNNFKTVDAINIGTKFVKNNKIVSLISKSIEQLQNVYDFVNVENGNAYLGNGLNNHNCLILDEYAFVPTHIADQFMSAVYPTIASGKSTKIAIISTPNGMNHFYKLWMDAQNARNGYKYVEAFWNEIPGRDEKFKKETIANIGELKWRQEFACEFLGSQQTLLDTQTISNFVWEESIYTNTEGLMVYEAPQKGHNYLLTVDTGKGNLQDYHAFSVIDCTAMPYKQVAKFRNNQLPYQMYPSHIAKIAKEYNEAYVLFELNDLGQPVADILKNELEYENVVTVVNRGSAGQRADFMSSGKSQNGVIMSVAVKKMGCGTLKDLIESGKLIVPDYETLMEFSTFVAAKNSYQAEEGYNDDLITTLILFAWLSTQQFFKDFTDTDIRKKLYELNLQRLEQEILPFGFRHDSSTEGEDEEQIDVFDDRTPEQKKKDAGKLWNTD